ncbi:MAG: hypothetical protein GXP55_25980 [Deltaproteobacteria bacterium]|nr:hypothetical protein [Deltaproteobacteria bacterium]
MPCRFRLAVLSLLALGGCYTSHELPSGFDSSVRPDSTTGPDAGLDAQVDAGFDAEVDAGFDAEVDAGLDAEIDANADSGIDAEPPVGPHPDPSTCRIEPTIYPFDDPVLEYEWPNGPVVHVSAIHVSMTPLVIDLMPRDSEDLEPVLVFISYPALSHRLPSPGILRIVDPRTDTTISYPPREDGIGVLEATANLAAGDINGDGENEIVGLGTYSGTYAFRADGSLLWTSAYPLASDLGTVVSHSISSGPAIADLDGDGSVEIIVGRTVLQGTDGELVWTGDETDGIATNQFFGPLPCVADLDGDGTQEVIAGNTAFHADGSVYWKPEGLRDGVCAVADILDDPGPEVVLVSTGYVRILDGQTGATLWVRRLEGRVGGLAIGGPPTVADFDGDGRPEIGVANGSEYGVYAPKCVGPGNPRGCLAEGLLWQSETSDASSSGTGSSVFDFNGDGKAEVVYNDERYFRIYDGTTGDILFQRPNSSRTRTENPTIADIDNDGDAEIIFSANAEAFYIREWWTDPGVEIWGDARGRWVGARRIWNQHSYHITNVEEDGSIPAHETPSWTGLNSYRQNLREGADVLVVPDLWGGHGSYECTGSGRATLSVEVANWGLERAGRAVVAFYRGRPGRGGVRVAEARTTRPLLPRGDSEVVQVEVELGPEVEDWYAVLDDPVEPAGGAIAECREGNNAALIWRPECP